MRELSSQKVKALPLPDGEADTNSSLQALNLSRDKLLPASTEPEQKPGTHNLKASVAMNASVVLLFPVELLSWLRSA